MQELLKSWLSQHRISPLAYPAFGLDFPSDLTTAPEGKIDPTQLPALPP
jgi:hypothetical protein